ncbi:MAG: BACON domain-containing protein [Vicinamibacterales bacterium]
MAILAAGCSKGNERRAVGSAPTAPSALGIALTAGSPLGASSGPLVNTGTRPEALEFRKALDAKYQTDLRRSVQTSYVDLEGDAVWMSEYIRYRLSGCAHAEAIQRVFAQIDGNPAGGECGASPTGLIAFPPRDQVFDFRRQLEVKYQQMGRGLSATYVDIEGSGIWMEQYMYHRANACSHTQAQEKVFNEIDGKGVQTVCYVPPDPCSFYFYGTNFVQIDGAGGPFTAEVVRNTGPGTCSWSATSDSAWLTITSGASSADGSTIRYNVATNLGSARTGKIRVSWEGGSAVLEVLQSDRIYVVNVSMFDYKESSSATNECQIKLFGGGPTTCSFVVDPHLPTAPATVAWSGVYDYYGVSKNPNATGSSLTFGFTESCKVGASTTGDLTDLNMTVTVTDAVGNVQTVVAPFRLRIFPC